MTLSDILVQDEKIKKIRDILPVYRYSELRDFYQRCNVHHSKVAKDIIDAAIKCNFETPFELSTCYHLFKDQYEDFTGTEEEDEYMKHEILNMNAYAFYNLLWFEQKYQIKP